MRKAIVTACGLCACVAWGIGLRVVADDQREGNAKDQATAKSTELVTRTYPVADFVIPIKPAKPRFDDVIEYIKGSTGEKVWNREGASIRTSEMTLSLVIRQTQDVHEQIADVLGQLRRQQDVQVSVAITIVSGPRKEIETLSAEFQGELGRTEQEALLERIQKSATVTQLIVPKITMFNRSAGVISNNEKTLVIQGEIADDRRSTRIRMAQYSKDKVEDTVTTFQSLVLHEGRAAAVRFEASRIIPGLPPVDEAEERLVIVTPKIIVQEEEEEKLNLGGVTPRVILQEEEEELLGIPTR